MLEVAGRADTGCDGVREKDRGIAHLLVGDSPCRHLSEEHEVVQEQVARWNAPREGREQRKRQVANHPPNLGLTVGPGELNRPSMREV